MNRIKKARVGLSVIAFLVLAFAGIGAVAHFTEPPEHGPTVGRTSDESAAANQAYLEYVWAKNPELRSEPNGNLLIVGYKICAQLHGFSETTLTNMADIDYPGAGKGIYHGATKYLCEAGS